MTCIDCSSAPSMKGRRVCKPCHKARVRYQHRNRRIKLRIAVAEYMRSNPCIDCGETDPIVLQFDHRDSNTKEHNVSDLVGNGNSWKMIQKEIDKCDVRCANCHARRTSKQFGYNQHL